MTVPFTSSHDPELLETLSFFEFAHLKTDYDGTCVFELEYPDGKISKKTVRVHPENGIKIFHGEPIDGVVTCRTSMKRDTFFDVYMGTVHPRNAIINGDVKVHGWAFREMSNFGASFDFATESWNRFYEWRKTQPPISVPSSRLRPLPFSLPRPRPCSSSSSDKPYNIPFISFLFAPATAVCEPSDSPYSGSISQSQVSVPSFAFSREHGQNALGAIQAHRTLSAPLSEYARSLAASVMGDKLEAVRPTLASLSSQVEQAGYRAAAKRAKVMQASQDWLCSVRRRIESYVQDTTVSASV